MKRIFLNLLAAATLVASSHAATVSYTNGATAMSNNVAYSLLLNKFNTGLGTLTGVTVTTVFLKDGGSFTVTANPGGSIVIDSATNALRAVMQLNDPSGTLGFTGYSNSAYIFNTTPDARGATVSDPVTSPWSNPQTFTVITNVIQTNAATVVASNFWAAYQGAGNVAFTLRQNPSVVNTVDGNSGTINTSLFFADAQMVVTYDYDPSVGVPEPATAVAGALVVAVGLVVSARRRRARA